MRRFLVGLGVLSAVAWVGALEIPLKHGSEESTRVGFVDMARIYRDYPELQKARADYQKELARHKSALAEKERALEELKLRVESLDSASVSPTASTETVMGSTESLNASSLPEVVPGDPEGLAKRKAELALLEESLTTARAEAVRALKELEEKQSTRILGRLYKALVAVAEERGISLVVDKSAILYGRDAVDLTEVLNRRVRGIPEPVVP